MPGTTSDCLAQRPASGRQQTQARTALVYSNPGAAELELPLQWHWRRPALASRANFKINLKSSSARFKLSLKSSFARTPSP